MTAEDMRLENKKMVEIWNSGEDYDANLFEVVQAKALWEIAAQLAEMNETLKLFKSESIGVYIRNGN